MLEKVFLMQFLRENEWDVEVKNVVSLVIVYISVNIMIVVVMMTLCTYIYLYMVTGLRRNWFPAKCGNRLYRKWFIICNFQTIWTVAHALKVTFLFGLFFLPASLG